MMIKLYSVVKLLFRRRFNKKTYEYNPKNNTNSTAVRQDTFLTITTKSSNKNTTL
jgi:hypothetical protein